MDVKVGENIKRGFYYIALILGLFFVISSQISYGFLYMLDIKGYLISMSKAALISIFVFFIYKYVVGKIRFLKEKRKNFILDIVLIFVFSFGIRYYLMNKVGITQYSDYLRYFTVALEYLENGEFSQFNQRYFAAIGNNGLIPVLFALFFKFAYPTIKSGLLLNLFFITASSYMMYFIVKEVYTRKVALIFSIVYSIFPNHLSYSLFFASEPMYMFFLVLGLLIFVWNEKRYKDEHLSLNSRSISWFLVLILSSYILSFSYLIRPISIAFILVMGISYFIIDVKDRAKKLFSFILCIVLSFTLLGFMYRPHYKQTENRSGWSFFEGGNPYTKGQWSKKSYDTLIYAIDNIPIEDVGDYLYQKGLEQYEDYDASDIFVLFSHKLSRLFGNSHEISNELRMYYTMPDRDRFLLDYGKVPDIYGKWAFNSTLFYQVIIVYTLCGAAKGIYNLLKGKNDKFTCTIVILSTGMSIFCISHMLVSALQRYNMPFLPFLFFWAVYSLDELAKNKTYKRE